MFSSVVMEIRGGRQIFREFFDNKDINLYFIIIQIKFNKIRPNFSEIEYQFFANGNPN